MRTADELWNRQTAKASRPAEVVQYYSEARLV